MKTVLLASVALLLAACTISGPRVSVKPIEIKPLEIEIGDGHHDSGSFCPPGQAKKGNCY